MKKFIIIIILQIFVLSARSELADQTKQYDRKAAKGLDEESEEETASDEDENFVKIIAEDLNFPSSGIKIIKAPDLSKDSDSKKISETLAMMLESQEKWIHKFEEELEEMNKIESPEEPEHEKTAEEIEGFIF